MAVEYQSQKKKNINSFLPMEIGTTEMKSLHSDLTTLLILAILKNYSTKEKPLKPSEIYGKIKELYGSYAKDIKSVKRKLNGLEYLSWLIDHNEFFDEMDDDTDDDNHSNNMANSITLNYYIAHILRITCNGRLRTVQEKTGGHKKYYFEPLLMDSHLDMLTSSVISNQYLSYDERNYILTSLSALGSSIRLQHKYPSAQSDNLQADWLDIFSAVPVTPFVGNNPSFAMLKHINLLYEAVSKGYKIEIIYGIYKKQPGKKTPVLTPKEKVLQVNPYALLFNNGRHYLLATMNDYIDPSHFRVDRIYDARLMRDPDDARLPMKRNPLPETLKPFFKGKIFQQEDYTNSCPLMSIYHDPNIIRATLQCTSTALGIIVDIFGKSNIHIMSEPNENSSHYKVSVRAQYDALVLVCAQQHLLLTVISPDNLIKDVTNKLKESLARYFGK